ncbi:MAG: hypothetical protein JXA97_12840 [Anaerolineales bacterium]|nr:hypothetical protein [Anaerolineales bacterium]
MQDTSTRARTVMAAAAGLAGLFMITAELFITQISLERVLNALLEVTESSPRYASGITLFSFFYPLWRAVGFVAGITLLVAAPALYRGETWAHATALTALAVPSISGMFMFLPYVSFVKGFPLPMTISWVGLVAYWIVLLLPKASRGERWVRFLVFTFIGMLATHSFTLGIGAQRMLWTRAEAPLFAGIEWWILTVVGEVDWIATALLIASIPLLALRKKTGWYFAQIAALSAFAIDLPTQLIRTATMDYLYGGILAAGLLVFLSIPSFKRVLIHTPSELKEMQS